MSKELIILKEPKIPTKWNYDQSVKKIKVLVYKWKNLTAGVFNELYVARDILSKPGSHQSSWGQYCEDVGMEQNTVNGWLRRFFLPVINHKEETPLLPEGKYQVIYADPPWQYAQEQHSKEKQETTLETHYPTMPTEDICKLPIQNLVGENAVLFLWTTSPKLFEAKLVIDAWGFNYKSSMIWDKVKHNVGYYVSVRHEFLLICTKGSCLPNNPKLHDSVITLERTEHSKKPDIFYEIIEEMYKGKKIELFARNKRKGWDSWGQEV
jgi:N6-adenosine-specific RNA methylase IME4